MLLLVLLFFFHYLFISFFNKDNGKDRCYKEFSHTVIFLTNQEVADILESFLLPYYWTERNWPIIYKKYWDGVEWYIPVNLRNSKRTVYRSRDWKPELSMPIPVDLRSRFCQLKNLPKYFCALLALKDAQCCTTLWDEEATWLYCEGIWLKGEKLDVSS